MKPIKYVLWIDLEMTGLDPRKDRILELAAIVTDWDFNKIGEYHQIVFQTPEILGAMNEWSQKHHAASGLTEACAHGRPLEDIEAEFNLWLNTWFAPTDAIVLAGNSVGNDRSFILAWMPELAKRLHYRVIDVSSWKEVFRHRYKIEAKKQDKHRALEDIMESIAELKHYLQFIHVQPVKSV